MRRRSEEIVRFSAILKAGFHPDSLNILKKEKKVEKICRVDGIIKPILEAML